MLAIDRLSSWLIVPLLVVSASFLVFFILLSVAAKGSRVGKMRRLDKAKIPRTVPNKSQFQDHQKHFCRVILSNEEHIQKKINCFVFFVVLNNM